MAPFETRSSYASVNGVRLHYVLSGTGPTVVLLHGFPETHRSWDLQVPTLVEAGFRTVAVDLRGYGRSDRPQTGYDLPNLAADVAGLIAALGTERVALVGHDWGGAITWEAASRYPELISAAVVIDCPHPAIMARALRVNRRQLRRSWYMFFFQLPVLPERWLARRDGRQIARMFREAPPAQATPAGEIVEAERRALLEPGALEAALAYYRTSLRAGLRQTFGRAPLPEYAPIEAPLTLIWGERDSCLGTELIEGSGRFAPNLRVEVVERAGHFVHQEQAERVNGLLLAALRSNLPA